MPLCAHELRVHHLLISISLVLVDFAGAFLLCARGTHLLAQCLPSLPLQSFLLLVADPPEEKIAEREKDEDDDKGEHDADFVAGSGARVEGPIWCLWILSHGLNC